MRDWIDLFEQSLTYPMADRDRDGWWSDGTFEIMGGEIVQMSPDEYLSRVRPLVIDDESEENIEELMDRIRNGQPLDPLKIYADGKEDGRHRAIAAKRLGIAQVPVIVFPPKPVLETWHSTARVDGHTIEVMENPTKAEFHKARMALTGPETDWPFRAFIYGDGSLLVWDAYIASHFDMGEHLPSNHLGGYLYLGKDRVLMNDLNYYYNEEYESEKTYRPLVRNVFIAIQNNMSLRRLYGAPVKVIGADNEEGTEVVIDQTFLDQHVVESDAKHVSN